FFFSSRRRHTISDRDWSSDVCSSDLQLKNRIGRGHIPRVAIAAEVHRQDLVLAHIDAVGELRHRLAADDLHDGLATGRAAAVTRSEERRVGKECRFRWWPVEYRPCER